MNARESADARCVRCRRARGVHRHRRRRCAAKYARHRHRARPPDAVVQGYTHTGYIHKQPSPSPKVPTRARRRQCATRLRAHRALTTGWARTAFARCVPRRRRSPEQARTLASRVADAISRDLARFASHNCASQFCRNSAELAAVTRTHEPRKLSIYQSRW